LPNYAVTKLEFSPDALSDTTPTYVDVTRYCQGAEWFGGVTKDTDSPQAGGATFQLKNLQRRFEPEYTAGAYYPNIVPGRRFRLTITADGVNYSQGTYYAREWKVEYPDPSLGYSVVTVACSDGFWRLANDTLPSLSPFTAESFADVAQADGPFAHYPLNETGGKTLSAVTGPEGTYKGAVQFGYQSALVGDNDPGVLFGDQSGAYARAPLADENVWHDANGVTLECTVQVITSPAASRTFCAGPWDTTAASPSFAIADSLVWMYNAGAVLNGVFLAGGSRLSPGTYHIALTYDGSTLVGYLNGAVTGTAQGSGDIISPDASEFMYIGGAGNHGMANRGDDIISQVVFYDYALSATRILAHANAALNRGYQAQTAGTRIAALATDPLWSTASIPVGSVTVAPTMQHGQSAMDEIIAAHSTELPGSLFFFNDAGNPDYNTLLETWTPAATFGDTPSEVNYQAIDLAYDDDLFNTANVSGPGLAGATATNTQSLGDYGNRGIDQTSLPLAFQSDAALLAQTYVDRFSTPAFRCESLTLNGADQDSRTQILTREIGDVIRVKRRGEGGVPIDIITRILGKSKSIDVHGNLVCTWSLARGFNASTAQWHLGVTGFSELGQTTVLG